MSAQNPCKLLVTNDPGVSGVMLFVKPLCPYALPGGSKTRPVSVLDHLH